MNTALQLVANIVSGVLTIIIIWWIWPGLRPDDDQSWRERISAWWRQLGKK